MSRRPKALTIINDMGSYAGYPFIYLTTKLIAAFREAFPRCTAGTRRIGESLLLALEGFVAVTQRKIRWNTPAHEASETFALFLGALNSPRFFAFPSPHTRYRYSRALLELLAKAHGSASYLRPLEVPLPYLRTGAELSRLIGLAEALPLDTNEVLIWSHYRVESKVGSPTFLPLRVVARRYGVELAEKIYEAALDHARARNRSYQACLMGMIWHMASLPKNVSAADFQNPAFTGEFIHDYYRAWMANKYSQHSSKTALEKEWHGNFEVFLNDYLFASNAFAKPFKSLPRSSVRTRGKLKANITNKATVSNFSSNKQEEVSASPPPSDNDADDSDDTASDDDGDDGESCEYDSSRIITLIPLHATNAKALDLLYRQLRQDWDSVMSFARSQVADMWTRFQRRQALAYNVEPLSVSAPGVANGNRVKLKRHNPRHLQYAAATIASGYKTSREETLRLTLPQPITQTAFELALPTSYALVPHLLVLVGNHPEIIPSFFDHLALYDEQGNEIGFTKTGGGYVLNGWKFRKGKAKSQMTVYLNEETTQIIQQIIEITELPRQYIKSHRTRKGPSHGDDWRYLLLSTGAAFAVPCRVRSTSKKLQRYITENIEAYASYHDCTTAEAISILERLTLRTLRNQTGIIIYIQTGSEDEVADKLGHSEYDPWLVRKYIPQWLIDFFQDRDLRILSEGLLLKAMEGSDHLLEASSFDTMDEVNEFLLNHSRSVIPDAYLDAYDRNQNEKQSTSLALLEISDATLDIFANLIEGVENAKSLSIPGHIFYWYCYGKALFSYLEENRVAEREFFEMMTEAKARVNPEWLSEMLNV
ncbi:hypothetical protein AB4Y38_13000 [Paraburkholderia sp. EG285A]|uniref:hypothetical protein n=1 Tax=Paraburkholderia sp. EG285A TaxID=3237009 RepID=UPI0034D3827C